MDNIAEEYNLVSEQDFRSLVVDKLGEIVAHINAESPASAAPTSAEVSSAEAAK